jgi:hypothetical protein
LDRIFKYRPLSEFLYKELYYQELYFASYNELNDPLDLSARIEFTSKDKEAIEYLIWFIFKTHLDFKELQNSNEDIRKLLKFNKDEEANNKLVEEIYKCVNSTLKTEEKIWTHDIIKIINDSIEKTQTDIVFDSTKFKSELERITNKFLKNSYVTCFSETNNDFLMWSHYASKHSGICLEFNLENGWTFPYEIKRKREQDKEKYKKRISEWDTKSSIYWDRIRKVSYEEEQPFINFYNFAAVFENEFDCDLIGLSKSWTHEYAHELEWVFSTKTNSWRYENEWRAIEINFGEAKEPEERIRHYPIESLTSVYFGVNTPEKVRNRIYKMLSNRNPKIDFFESILNGTNTIEFSYWEYLEE